MILRALKTLVFADSCSRFTAFNDFRRTPRALFRNLHFYHVNSLLFKGVFQQAKRKRRTGAVFTLAAVILHDLTYVEKPCFSHTVVAVLLFPSYFVVVFERFFGIFTFTLRLACFSMAVFMETKRQHCTGCSVHICGCDSVIWGPSGPLWNP